MANRRFIDFPIASTSGDTDIILIWQDGANKQTTKATFLSGLPENLDELNDVAISGLTNGQILRYDSVTGKWENTDQGNLDLNDLNDVQIVSPSNGQVLVYNSSTSKWENSSGGYVPYTGAVTTVNLGAQTIQAGSFVKAGGTSAQFLKANGSVDSTAYGTGSVTSVALTMPSAFSVANSPVTTAGTLAVTGAGTVGQYIRGDGSLADFPESSGGGSSVSYYLNGSVNQGTIGGVAYKELNKVPVLGAGTDFTIAADGYIASFITDAGDPNLLEIPAGNWNFETYFSASSGGGSPTFYVELYKYDGSTFTLIASSSSVPELIAFGTTTTPYFSSLAVPTTVLALTDRLAVRYYVTHSGRTITLHTENNHLCQIITTFTTGITALNGLTAQVQNFAVGTTGTDFAIASATATHTFNLPTASATNRGALSSADWSSFNGKVPYTGAVASVDLGVYSITANAINSVGSGSTAGQINLRSDAFFSLVNGYGSIASGTTNQFNLYQTTGAGVFRGAILSLNSITASATRTFTLPDADGTIALVGGAGVGTVTSVAALTLGTSGTDLSSTVANSTTTPVITLNVPTASATNRGALSSTDWTTFNSKQNALTNPVTGTGASGQVAYFTGTTAISSESNLFWDATNDRLGIGTPIPSQLLHLQTNFASSSGVGTALQITSDGAGGDQAWIGVNKGAGNGLEFSVENRDIIFNTGATTPFGGNERLRIFAGGNTHIGPTPAADNGARLQVSGDSTFSSSVSAGTNFISVPNTNSISVGTSAAENAKYNYLGHSGYWGIKTTTTGFNFAIDTYNGGTPKNVLTITQAGAATFSSSVTAGVVISRRDATTSGTDAQFISENRTGTSGQYAIYGSRLDNGSGAGFVPVAFGAIQTSGAGRTGDFIVAVSNTDNVNLSTHERLKITSGGNVLIGSPPAADNGARLQVNVTGITGNGLTISSTGGNYMYLGGIASSKQYLYGFETELSFGNVYSLGYTTLWAGNTERIRITSGGYLKASNTGTYLNSTSPYHELVSNQTAANVAIFTHTHSSDTYGPQVFFQNAAPNNSTNYFLLCSDSSANRFIVYSNGNVANTNGSYGSISDYKLKENIKDATPKLNDLIKVKVRNYNLIGDDQKQIGVIAQELEEIFPSLIDMDGKTNIKSVKYSVFVPMLIKAIQELKQEIDTLKN